MLCSIGSSAETVAASPRVPRYCKTFLQFLPIDVRLTIGIDVKDDQQQGLSDDLRGVDAAGKLPKVEFARLAFELDAATASVKDLRAASPLSRRNLQAAMPPR